MELQAIQGDSGMAVSQAFLPGPTHEPTGPLMEPLPCTRSLAEGFLEEELRLNAELRQLQFPEPVGVIYNPVDYAWEPHSNYVTRYCQGPKEVLFLGMNPGPFGMAQTGVPFGEVNVVRDWLGVGGSVRTPPQEHPKRPVLGLECTQSEVSGARFWGLFRALCGQPHVFFRHCFVHNLCPLLFLAPSGRNLTPAELPAKQREQLLMICDAALCRQVQLLGVRLVVGVGRLAEQRARRALAGLSPEVQVEGLLHPSPRSPQANKGWEAAARERLQELGLLPLLTSECPARSSTP
ncbi:single-strand selective monofunctional uracil DNA glycosylase isoform X1 [Cricetulus griseus]|uniref:Single-strand selective monofunctional uracil DNA glycosylase isoform X1 n=2 Tax=Cricetulus griseus TaxID=10029 RepID=A0A9J7F7L8_CRIGR|nr:single-strand selective monofunctional uracil DNA glycosylase isoform X1 [Cricetulus griseus]XP_027241054.1 single-strand selective monofunctional uracil DNA glycosylase isoform X1 [Cricetulus griseus]XP_027241055.1 single-strand selective monofunctional uracil DNA glycosylase isoform X1 [Cricetulus griseus]XP_027252563.1 single-strand selective monofunctional uracil DNA glycosylase isoform X1 [Cricetulus griseus]XP_027252564.1 single-strand selective monofunctional uracil DNA glycosylase is